MSVELVRSLYDDFARGDFEAALGKLDEDVQWGAPPDVPDQPEPFRGRQGVIEGFTRFMGAWEQLDAEVEECTAVGDAVLVVTRWVGRSRGTGIEVEQRHGQLFEFRDGRVVRVRQFREPEDARREAGL